MTPAPAFVALVLRAETQAAPASIVALGCDLAEDHQTVVLTYLLEGGEWRSLSYDLPAPMDPDEFDSGAYIDAARDLLYRPAGTAIH